MSLKRNNSLLTVIENIDSQHKELFKFYKQQTAIGIIEIYI